MSLETPDYSQTTLRKFGEVPSPQHPAERAELGASVMHSTSTKVILSMVPGTGDNDNEQNRQNRLPLLCLQSSGWPFRFRDVKG